MRRLGVMLTIALLLGALAGPAAAEQAGSRARTFQAGLLDAGTEYSCAVLHDGSAACWGRDNYGQLGDDALLADQPSPVPVALPAGRTAVAISAGLGHACAVLDDGSAVCWGVDGNGQLGDDALLADRPTPATVALPAGRTATAISAGNDHACAILDNGSLTCWGFDAYGQLGDDATPADRPTPTTVALPAGRTATAITAGRYHTCAILDNGGATCWGWDIAGQLGDDTTLADKPTPVPVALPAGRTATAISAGPAHTCAILDDGSVSCWGDDSRGQLGDDAILAGKPTPVTVALPAGRTAAAISAGGSQTCAILDNGSATCWGRDDAGQLGDDPTLADQPTPVTVALPAGRTATAINSGGGHTCAILDTGTVVCWGVDGFGQLGNGLDGTQQPVAALAPPALVAGSSVGRAADLSVGLEGAPAGLLVGAGGTATVRVTNAGPDSATGLRVLLQPTLLSLAATVIGQGSLDGAYWTTGTLAPGATTTLTLTLTGLAAGAGGLTAQVAAAGQADPDSTPANGAAGEDDQASAAVAIAAAPAPPPPAPTKAAPEKLTLALSTGKDTTAPHTATASGRLVAGAVADRTACVGKVTITARAGKKTLLTRTATLKLKNGACEYTTRLSLTAKQRGTARSVKVTATFPGNDALLAASSKAATLKLV